MLRRVAVFGSADLVADPEHLAAAQRVGRLLGENAITLVFDGSALGTVGALAEATVKAGGRLVGVGLADAPGPTRDDLAEHRRVESIAVWRAELAGLADAWLALPGAFDRLESAFDVWGWADRPAREQPLGLLDHAGFYSSLLKTASDPAVDRFVLESQRGRLVVARDAAEILRRMADYRPPETRRDALDDD